ncbi:MAG: M23 family metallopeptidase [Gammaproteobacteria bacterium]|nr:M23 family metallopeptidase [Gammaproteobacteria bacterium]MDH4314963.1 M23 family metallopeptidase [Gammaproteobacteria bacterium]MDH5214371.1 M23 family metallopeptidase [Gammaproteobacteria bacterium]
MAGSDLRSADVSSARRRSALTAGAGLFVAVVVMSHVAVAQALYKYRGADGEWIFSDRPPAEERTVEIRELQRGPGKPKVQVVDRRFDRQIGLIALNEFYSPVEVVLALDELRNVGLPPPDTSLRWVVPARSSAELLRLDAIEDNAASGISYRFIWVAGDPDSEHLPPRPYRAPFALSRAYRISQAFPVGITHTTPDSRYAVDIAMPVGTDVYAARGGIVVEVAATNYRGGLDTSREGAEANLVRILHDDGTFAIYAHLSLNSIRVKPGDEVVRGQYIAESGNTGFSSGPHLHFAIVRNRNLRMDSVPFVFEGQGGSEVTPETGVELRAY